MQGQGQYLQMYKMLVKHMITIGDRITTLTENGISKINIVPKFQYSQFFSIKEFSDIFPQETIRAAIIFQF